MVGDWEGQRGGLEKGEGGDGAKDWSEGERP